MFSKYLLYKRNLYFYSQCKKKICSYPNISTFTKLLTTRLKGEQSDGVKLKHYLFFFSEQIFYNIDKFIDVWVRNTIGASVKFYHCSSLMFVCLVHDGSFRQHQYVYAVDVDLEFFEGLLEKNTSIMVTLFTTV